MKMTCNLCCSGCLEWTGRGICQFGQHDNNLGSVCDAGHDFYAETLYKRLLNSDNTSSRAVTWTGAAFSSGHQVPFYFLPSFLPFPLKLLELLRFFEVLPRDPLLLPHPSLLIPPPPPPGATSLDRARLNFFTPLPTKCFTSPNKLIPWVSSTCVLNALRPICDACSERGKGHVSGVFDVDGRANQGCGFLEKTTSGRPENDQLPREVCPAFCIYKFLTYQKESRGDDGSWLHDRSLALILHTRRTLVRPLQLRILSFYGSARPRHPSGSREVSYGEHLNGWLSAARALLCVV